MGAYQSFADDEESVPSSTLPNNVVSTFVVSLQKKESKKKDYVIIICLVVRLFHTINLWDALHFWKLLACVEKPTDPQTQ